MQIYPLFVFIHPLHELLQKPCSKFIITEEKKMKKLKRLLALLLSSILLLTVTGCTAKTTEEAPAPTETTSKVTSETPAETSPEKDFPYDGFHIIGSKLLDANGNEFVFRGINHAHTWFKGERDIAFKAVADTGSNTVRVVLSDGVQWTKDDVDAVKEIIALCKELEMISVLEVHDATGKNSVDDLEKAADYWIEIKDALVGNEAYVILNIANEWYGEWKSDVWADGYKKVIPKLRDAGIKNTILVDSAGWGQYGKSLADKGAEVLAADPLQNTMFAIHMYGSAGKNEKTIKSNIDNALSEGLCVCIGEFGYLHSDGDVDEAYIMSYCEETGVGYLGWSWKGNGGGVEYLDIAEKWDGSVLSPEWGEPLINGENGIKATAKKCTVFD